MLSTLLPAMIERCSSNQTSSTVSEMIVQILLRWATTVATDFKAAVITLPEKQKQQLEHALRTTMQSKSTQSNSYSNYVATATKRSVTPLCIDASKFS
jgi:hypothetical protein